MSWPKRLLKKTRRYQGERHGLLDTRQVLGRLPCSIEEMRQRSTWTLLRRCIIIEEKLLWMLLSLSLSLSPSLPLSLTLSVGAVSYAQTILHMMQQIRELKHVWNLLKLPLKASFMSSGSGSNAASAWHMPCVRTMPPKHKHQRCLTAERPKPSNKWDSWVDQSKICTECDRGTDVCVHVVLSPAIQGGFCSEKLVLHWLCLGCLKNRRPLSASGEIGSAQAKGLKWTSCKSVCHKADLLDQFWDEDYSCQKL